MTYAGTEVRRGPKPKENKENVEPPSPNPTAPAITVSPPDEPIDPLKDKFGKDVFDGGSLE